jgi:hypothetical protein
VRLMHGCTNMLQQLSWLYTEHAKHATIFETSASLAAVAHGLSRRCLSSRACSRARSCNTVHGMQHHHAKA